MVIFLKTSASWLYYQVVPLYTLPPVARAAAVVVALNQQPSMATLSSSWCQIAMNQPCASASTRCERFTTMLAIIIIVRPIATIAQDRITGPVMRTPYRLAVAITAALTSAHSVAEGYKLYEQSISSMANAYAGRGAQISDATLVYSNPAALTELQGAQLSGGGSLIYATSRYRDAKATSAQGAPVQGRTHDENSLVQPVPFFFYSDKVQPDLGYGFGVFAPFGLSSDYADDFVGRYFADETAVQVVALQGSVGYRLNSVWSVGAALNLNHASGKLSKFKDHNGLCELGTGVNALYRMDVYNPAYCQSHYAVEGDDIGVGYSLSLLAKPLTNTTLALVYHSAVRYTLEGDSTISNTPITGANVTGIPGFISVAPNLPAINSRTGKLASNPWLTEASALALTTPASLVMSADQRLTPAWSVQASVQWTQWSEFENISIISTAAPPTISLSTQQSSNLAKTGYIGYIPEYWQNSWSASVGVTHDYTPDMQLKLGFAFDENPIEQAHRTARVPTNDRTWLTFGATYTLNQALSLDWAYGYLWMPATQINEREYNANDVALYKSGLQMRVKNHAHVAGVQLNYKF